MMKRKLTHTRNLFPTMTVNPTNNNVTLFNGTGNTDWPNMLSATNVSTWEPSVVERLNTAIKDLNQMMLAAGTVDETDGAYQEICAMYDEIYFIISNRRQLNEEAKSVTAAARNERIESQLSDIEITYNPDTGEIHHARFGDMTQLIGRGVARLIERGNPVDHVVAFLSNLFSHDRERVWADFGQAQQFFANHQRVMDSYASLVEFMANDSLSITPDGYCVGVKAVMLEHNGDIYNGRFTGNQPKIYYNDGETVVEQEFSYSRNSGCGSGLHIGTMNYALSWGRNPDLSRIILCKFHPAHVVSCGASDWKIRVFQLEVLGEIDYSEEAWADYLAQMDDDFDYTNVPDFDTEAEWAFWQSEQDEDEDIEETVAVYEQETEVAAEEANEHVRNTVANLLAGLMSGGGSMSIHHSNGIQIQIRQPEVERGDDEPNNPYGDDY